MADVKEKPHQLIASDRVEGTAVRRPNGERIGHIERLMIDKVTGKVSYAILSFGGFLGIGANLLPLPWARLTYNTAFEAYELDIDDDELRRAPSFRTDKDFDWGDRSRKPNCIDITEYRHTGAGSDRSFGDCVALQRAARFIVRAWPVLARRKRHGAPHPFSADLPMLGSSVAGASAFCLIPNGRTI